MSESDAVVVVEVVSVAARRAECSVSGVLG